MHILRSPLPAPPGLCRSNAPPRLERARDDLPSDGEPHARQSRSEFQPHGSRSRDTPENFDFPQSPSKQPWCGALSSSSGGQSYPRRRCSSDVGGDRSFSRGVPHHPSDPRAPRISRTRAPSPRARIPATPTPMSPTAGGPLAAATAHSTARRGKSFGHDQPCRRGEATANLFDVLDHLHGPAHGVAA